MRSISSGLPTTRTASGSVQAPEANPAARAFEASLRNAARGESWTGAGGPGRDAGFAQALPSETEAPKPPVGFAGLSPSPHAVDEPSYAACGPIPLPAAPLPLPGPMVRLEAAPAKPATWLGTLTEA